MKRLLLILLFTALCTITAFSQTDLQPAATVSLTRSEPITVRQLRTEVERIEATTGEKLTVEQRKEVLEGMINERLIIQAATRDRIMVSENEVNQQIQQLRAVLAQTIGRQPTDAEFAQAVKNEYKMELSAFREQLQKRIIIQKYLEAKKGDLLRSISVPTEEEIKDQYELIKTQLVRPETVRFTMILVPFGDNAQTRTAARQLADRLHREIGANPSNFDDAVAKSAAPNSGYQAGDVGYIPRTQEARNLLGQDLLNAAFTVKQGQVSNVIESTQGFSIIKVTENHSQKNLNLDDIMQLGTRITVRDYIGQTMLNERQQEVLLKAMEELVAEIRVTAKFQINENYLNW